uniref:Uncharacterized protein n=1 Tax=Mus spicilegus TaxID=10103 RepID=A0A8C6IF80_MUSSI
MLKDKTMLPFHFMYHFRNTHTYMYKCICVHMYTCTHIYVYVYMDTWIYGYVYMLLKSYLHQSLEHPSPCWSKGAWEYEYSHTKDKAFYCLLPMHGKDVVRTQRITVFGVTSYNNIGAEGTGGLVQVTPLTIQSTKQAPQRNLWRFLSF